MQFPVTDTRRSTISPRLRIALRLHLFTRDVG